MMASSFLMAPCVWLFAREIHQNAAPRLWPIAWGQSAVVLLGCLLTVPLLLTSHEGSLLVDSARPVPAMGGLAGYTHITMVAAVLLYLMQVPWYLARCLHLFRERVRINKFLFSNIEEPTLNALRALMWVMAANWLLGLARTLRVMVYHPSQAWDVFFSGSEVAVTLVALYAIFKGYWHYNFAEQLNVQALAPEVLNSNEVTENKKYAKSSLDQTTRARVLKKVVEQFEQDKIYRKSSLKLQDLCDATKESSHYVSQVINQDLGLNFFDLVNRYRIEEAKRRLKQENKLLILDLALDLGFNAKSTFNKVFKETTGKTPSAYRSE